MDRHGASEAERDTEAGTSLMPQSFSKRGSAICTGSAEVTEGYHMRFAEYATRILALLQEDGMGKGKTSTGSLGLPPCGLLCCHCCPSQTATQTMRGSFQFHLSHE